MRRHRELKFALERFWSGEWSAEQLAAAAREIRRNRWQMQAAAGIHNIPSNDFSLYHHVLDTAVLVGAIPARYRDRAATAGTGNLFRNGARNPWSIRHGDDEKRFDTNYHWTGSRIHARNDFSLQRVGSLLRNFSKPVRSSCRRPCAAWASIVCTSGKIRDAHLDRSDFAEALVKYMGTFSVNRHRLVQTGFRSMNRTWGLNWPHPTGCCSAASTTASRRTYPASRSCLQPISRNSARISPWRFGSLSQVYTWIWFAAPASCLARSIRHRPACCCHWV